MQGFYNLSNKIRETLQLDAFVNTVTYGDLFEVDLNKQTIFPLSHVMISGATMQGNVWNFSVSVLCMDIVLNTQMAVANRLLELLLRGDLYVEKYQLEGDPQIEFFVDRFENKLAGVTTTFNVLVPNEMTIC